MVHNWHITARRVTWVKRTVDLTIETIASDDYGMYILCIAVMKMKIITIVATSVGQGVRGIF